MKITYLGSLVKAKTGIERVNEELIRKLIKDNEIDFIDIVTSTDRANLAEDIVETDKVKIHIFPAHLFKLPFFVTRFLKTVYKNPICIIANIRPLAILAYKFYPFFRKNVKIIQIVPDIIAWHYPKFFPFINSLTFKLFGLFFKNFPALYIVHSEFTKRDLIKSWGISESKIEVVPLGSFIKPMEPRENFDGDKILYVGTIEPRKGVDKLLDAFEIVIKEIPEAKLTICGRIGWKVKNLIKRLNELITKNENVKYLGYVSDDELKKLFREVDVCVYPSFYEGFGLPPLEAMACGCPVIASNTSSLPEVVGDAGILVNPNDVNEMARAIIRVLNDYNLKREMSLKGIQQAKKMDLEINLDRFVEIIKNLKR